MARRAGSSGRGSAAVTALSSAHGVPRVHDGTTVACLVAGPGAPDGRPGRPARRAVVRRALGAPSLALLAGVRRRSAERRPRSGRERGSAAQPGRAALPRLHGPAHQCSLPRPARAGHARRAAPRSQRRLRPGHAGRAAPCVGLRRAVVARGGRPRRHRAPAGDAHAGRAGRRARGWAVASMAGVPPLDRVIESERAPWLLVLVPFGVAAYAFAAWRYLRLYRARRRPLPLAVAGGFVLLAEALVAMAFGRAWRASWWEWHVLMAVAFATILVAARHEYRTAHSVSGAFG